MTTVDLAQVDRELSQIIEPTGSALAQTRRTVEQERDALTEVRSDLQERLAQIEQRLTTLEETDRQLAALQEAVASGPAGSSGNGDGDRSMSELAQDVLRGASRPLEVDAIAEQIEQRTGGEVDKRGLAGALNGGVRGGRFAKTRAGRFKLAS